MLIILCSKFLLLPPFAERVKEDTLEFFSPIDFNCFSQSGLKIKQKVKKMVTWTDFKKK